MTRSKCVDAEIGWPRKAVASATRKSGVCFRPRKLLRAEISIFLGDVEARKAWPMESRDRSQQACCGRFRSLLPAGKPPKGTLRCAMVRSRPKEIVFAGQVVDVPLVAVHAVHQSGMVLRVCLGTCVRLAQRAFSRRYGSAPIDRRAVADVKLLPRALFRNRRCWSRMAGERRPSMMLFSAKSGGARRK